MGRYTHQIAHAIEVFQNIERYGGDTSNATLSRLRWIYRRKDHHPPTAISWNFGMGTIKDLPVITASQSSR
jgi:hypothetical protein